MSTYAKVFESILRSTVWEYDPAIKVVWITMLVLADRDGRVEASVPGLARAAGVQRAEVERALALFAAPDIDSRTKEHEGRRIREVDGGWILLNYEKYRERKSSAEVRAADAARQARKRERDKAAVTPRHAPSRASHAESLPQAQAQAQAQAHLSSSDPSGGSDPVARATPPPVPERPPAPVAPALDPGVAYAGWCRRWREAYGEREPGGRHFDARRCALSDTWLEVVLLAEREAAATGSTPQAVLDRALDALFADPWHRERGHQPTALVTQWAQLLTPKTQGYLLPSTGPLGYGDEDIPPAPPAPKRKSA